MFARSKTQPFKFTLIQAPGSSVEVEGKSLQYKLPFGHLAALELLMLTQNTPLTLAGLNPKCYIAEHLIIEEYGGIMCD